jgi:hypothetical protein
MDFSFTGEVIEWRGPAPYYFVRIPKRLYAAIKDAAKGLEYWGQVAVAVTIGDTEFTTALFPKDGVYLLPLRVAIRRAEGIEEGEPIEVAMTIAERD